ncbi:MAG: DUF6351 family protein [Pseudomonadota bacterium]|nr:DUF6351 family protein [Pseudomonadota bacterium]
MYNSLQLSMALLLPFLLGTLIACSSEEPISTAGSNFEPPDEADLHLRAVSSKPWLVTGGDVLVELELAEPMAGSTITLEINGVDVSEKLVSISPQVSQALLTGLPEGDNLLLATAGQQQRQLSLTNYPLSGPIISGPHEVPFYCQTSEFKKVNGEMFGTGPESGCEGPVQTDYVYYSTEQQAFLPYTLTFGLLPPVDMAELVIGDGESRPFIVRVETGVVNRAIYEIAMLHDPVDPDPDPWTRSAGWNGKLVYTHGGGCRSGWYQQGTATGGVLRKELLERGYALASSTLNVFGQNCNDLLASETHIMVKERFIERFGEPLYTIATGVSGGSYQSHQTADNYPGIFDGIIVGLSFPDVTSSTIFTVSDSRLLHHYFTQTSPESFTSEQQRAVAGFGVWDSIANLARGAARLDPIYTPGGEAEEQGGEVSVAALEDMRYSRFDENGVRATVYDHTVNVYGLVPDTGAARRPLDNEGVQYGLAALNNGEISVRQFLDLNRDIGGFDRDMNHVPERHQSDPEAARRAIESGRILYGGAGLASTPVIDYRTYMDAREGGDIHMLVHQFSTRQRLANANGHTENHVMQIGGRWGFTEQAPDLGALFSHMDDWLMGIRNDRTASDLAEKVRAHKPAGLTDACWREPEAPLSESEREPETEGSRQRLEQAQSYRGRGECGTLYRAFSTPRQVAGAPLANDVVACHLRSPYRDDYSVEFSEAEFAELRSIFSTGVCDWSRSDRSGASHQGVWKSFGPSPVNRLY